MEKRGQITIFLIVGVLMLVVTAGILFLVKNKTMGKLEPEISENQPIESAAVKILVESCLEKTAEEAIHYNFLTGGFYQPTKITLYGQWKVPYYFYLGEDLHPLQKQIEEGLSEYIKKHLNDCLQDFQNLPNVRRTTATLSPEVKIREKNVLIRLELPLEIKEKEQTKDLKLFETTLDVPLSEVLTFLNQFSAEQQAEPNEIAHTFLVDNTINTNYTFNIFYQGEEIIHILKFNDILVRNNPLEVQYATKYNWSEEAE